MPNSSVAAREPLPSRLRAAASAGYVGLWMHYRDYLEMRRGGIEDAALRSHFDELDLPHRGIEFLTDWFLDTSGAREAEAAAFSAAQAIGASVVNVGTDFRGRGFPKAEMIKAFKRLCSRAADKGLSLALEIVPWSDVSDIETALDYMAPSNAGLVLDCWHIFRGGIDLSDLLRVPPERILCVQVSDAAVAPQGALQEDTLNRRLCGEGSLDLAGFRDTLDRMQVACPYSVEVISPVLASLDAREAAEISYSTARQFF